MNKSILCGGLIIIAYALAVAAATPQAQIPATQGLVLTVHDAAGHTFNVTARYNSFKFYDPAGTITLDYTSDQLLCSGFGN